MRAWIMGWVLCSVAYASPDVAVVTDLRGDVRHQAGEAQPWRSAALDDGLALLDLIHTGVRSKTEMRFVDRTVLGIGEKTRLRISMALFDVQQAPEGVRVALLAGQIDAAVHRTARPLVVRAPDGSEARLTPGQRARVRLVNGALRVEALPTGFRFTADPFEDDGWLDGVDGAAPETPLGPGTQPPGAVDPSVPPGALEPLGDDGPIAQEPAPDTGVDITLRPRSTP
jgi:hypothetical protein